MIRVAIVEDDFSSAVILKKFLERYCEEHNEEVEISVFNNGIEFIENFTSAIDIIFMDIEMPFLNGMDTAKKIREMDPFVCIIFVTHMIQFAVKGYEVDAMYFIVKPIEYFDFSIKLKKAIQFCENNSSEEILLKFTTGFKRVRIADIKYIEVMGHNLIYHLPEGKNTIKGTLKNLEKTLSSKNFSRCNNAYLVNLKYVTALEQNAITIGNEKLQISRTKKKAFLNDLTKFLGGIYR